MPPFFAHHLNISLSLSLSPPPQHPSLFLNLSESLSQAKKSYLIAKHFLETLRVALATPLRRIWLFAEGTDYFLYHLN